MFLAFYEGVFGIFKGCVLHFFLGMCLASVVAKVLISYDSDL